MSFLDKIDPKTLPRHVAIIMDGNGRWATRRHIPRLHGHRHAVKAVRACVEASAELGLQVLTLYAFSTENWQRPENEINFLFNYMMLQRDAVDFMVKNNKVNPVNPFIGIYVL